jgi:AraC-like DNA-binding protein
LFIAIGALLSEMNIPGATASSKATGFLHDIRKNLKLIAAWTHELFDLMSHIDKIDSLSPPSLYSKPPILAHAIIATGHATWSREMFDPQKINQAAFHYYASLRKLKQYVDEHSSESLCLQTAARIAGFEQSYFSAYFRAKTGVCFKEWIDYVQVTRAIEIMKVRDDTITTIALAVGFNDLRTFERAFRRCTGTTPREIRRSLRPAEAPASPGSRDLTRSDASSPTSAEPR